MTRMSHPNSVRHPPFSAPAVSPHIEEAVNRDATRDSMKITAVRTRIVDFDYFNALLVWIDTDAGITGVAETVLKRHTATIEQGIHLLRSYLIGKDPTAIEDHWEKMYRDSFWVGGPMHATIISAVDCALWDILARSLGVAVHKLFGGPTRRQVMAYCHCPGGNTPEEFAANVKDCARRGYRAFKTTLPLFYGAPVNNGALPSGYSGTSGEIDSSWKETEYLDPAIFRRIREFFVAAREAAGPHMGMALDVHGRFNVKGAIRLCEALDGLDLMFVEEPVPPENVEALAAVQRATSIPIAAGERWVTVHGVRPFLEKQAVDLLQCDLVNCGGLTALKKIAALAEAHYVGLAPHNPNGPLATLMNLQFAAAIPNFHILETIGSELSARHFRRVTGRELMLENGSLPVSTGPGFDVEIDEASLPPSKQEYAGSR
jgi:galactonate dehydratase